MNRKYLIIIGFSFLLSLIAIIHGISKSQRTLNILEITLAELKNIEVVTDAKEAVSANNIDHELSSAFRELDSVTKMVEFGLNQTFQLTAVKRQPINISFGGGSPDPDIYFFETNVSDDKFVEEIVMANRHTNKTVLANTQAIQGALEKIKADNLKREQVVTELIASFSRLQTQYINKTSELENNISAVQKGNSGKGLDFWGSILGLMTGISTLFLAWRNDNREVKSLQIKLSEYHANQLKQRDRS